MPPRKSDIAKPAVATGDETAATPVKEAGVSIEDLNLPKSIVARLAKSVLPPNTQIQGNAMLGMSKSATVFVNYLAAQANDNAQSRSIKTIQPQDVMKALDDLEFPDFKPRLEAELAKFIETQSDKRNTYRKKVAADKAAGGHGEVDDGEAQERGDGEPKAKKARREGKAVANTGARVTRGNEEVEGEDTLGGGEEENEGEGEGEGEEDQDEEEEEEGEGDEDEGDEERFEVEEPETKEVEDEALDNGEDSE